MEPKRDYVILVYLLLSLAVYFTDSIFLSVILLHLNIFSTWGLCVFHDALFVHNNKHNTTKTDLAVCFRVKALDDAFSAALQPLTRAIEAMFLLVC